MSKMPSNFDHSPRVGGTSMGTNNKVGTQGKEPEKGKTGPVGAIAAFSSTSKGTVNKGVLSTEEAPIGGKNKGK